jgi:glycosyltransferase involved in cell wall biosynthesis
MKILYFSRSYGPHDSRFLSAIVESGHQTFFVCREKRSLNRAVPELPKGVAELPWQGRLNQVIDQVHPDLVHAGPLPSCGYLAAKTEFQPIVQMSWGSDLLWEARRNPFARWRAKYALRRAAAVIADCETVRAAAVAFGAFPARIITFPWGVDLTRFHPNKNDGSWRARLDWQDMIVLLHLRAWEPLYDPLTLAKAFVFAAQRESRLRLFLLGAGSLAGRISDIFAKHGVLDRVHMPGQLGQAELPEIFRTANLYISASQSDGSSVSLMEALASGLPALVSDIPGNREWVQSGREGWHFPVKDHTALANLILQTVAQPEQLRLMGQQARLTAEAHADWKQNKSGLTKAYDLALGGVA